MDWRERISIDPAIRFGKPCIRGTRITVADVLGWLAAGMTIDEIVADYPPLSREDVLCCLSKAAEDQGAQRGSGVA
jgi:uncharacterized protein (DUF433 family)